MSCYAIRLSSRSLLDFSLQERLANLRQTVEAELVVQREELDERSASIDRKLAEVRDALLISTTPRVDSGRLRFEYV